MTTIKSIPLPMDGTVTVFVQSVGQAVTMVENMLKDFGKDASDFHIESLRAEPEMTMDGIVVGWHVQAECKITPKAKTEEVPS